MSNHATWSTNVDHILAPCLPNHYLFDQSYVLPSVKNKSPCELIFKDTPKYNKLKPFGCLVYLWLKPYNPTKLESKSKPFIFIGYTSLQNAYKCFNVSINQGLCVIPFHFVETIFPYSRLIEEINHNPPSSIVHARNSVERSCSSKAVKILYGGRKWQKCLMSSGQ